MRKVKMVGYSVLALLAISVVASASASAALPEFTPVPNAFTAKSGKATLQQKGGATVTCKTSETTAKAKNEVKTEKTGVYDILFLGCETLGKVCTGLTDTVAGSILSIGTFSISYLSKAAKTVGIKLETGEVHFECGAGAALLTVKGCALGSLEKVNTKTKTLTLNLTQKEGANELILDEAKTECKLLSQNEAKGFLQSGEGAVEAVITTEKEGELKA